MLFPVLSEFAHTHHLKTYPADEQNYYPDMTFEDESDQTVYAVDVKTTYRKGENKVNGFTLGAFTGYFRNRSSSKNITRPYNDYKKHYVLGLIYTQTSEKIDETNTYSIDEVEKISSVIRDIDFTFQEKYKIAGTRPGSGNTKNIGSVTELDQLMNGTGPFSTLGIRYFDEYWMYYQTKDMMRGGTPPYANLEQFLQYRGYGK